MFIIIWICGVNYFNLIKKKYRRTTEKSLKRKEPEDEDDWSSIEKTYTPLNLQKELFKLRHHPSVRDLPILSNEIG